MRFRLFRRANGKFYCEDSTTGKQLSLLTGDRTQAQRLVHAKNEAELQPDINLRIAQAYLNCMLRNTNVMIQRKMDVISAVASDIWSACFFR